MARSPEVEDEHINKAIDGLQTLFDDKSIPRGASRCTLRARTVSADDGRTGWCVDRRSCDSQRLYARAAAERGLPLLYSADSTSDELPFWLPSPLADEGKDDQGLLIVPYQNDTSDAKFTVKGGGWATPKDFYTYLVDTFDVLYEEGQEGEPKMMSIMLHPHIVGHPNRTIYLEKFIDYIKSKQDVWIATREDIAKHWAQTFPYDPKTCFGRTKQVPCA